MQNNKAIYMDHLAALEDLQKYMMSLSFKDFCTQPHHKEKREQFVALLFCFGFSKYTGRKWFLKMREKDPPDFRMVSKIDEKSFLTEDIEIVTIPEKALKKKNFENEVMELIFQTKIDKKAYPEHYILCIHLSFEKPQFDFAQLIEKIHSLHPKFKMIWIVYVNEYDLNDLSKAKIGMRIIWPDVHSVNFSFADLEKSY